MPIKETASNFDVKLCLEQDFTGSAVASGAILDTRDYDGGVGFVMTVTACTSGSFALALEHGDDASLTDKATVSGSNLLWTTNPIVVSGGAHSDGDLLPKQAVLGTKRYVRALVNGTGGSTGTVSVHAIMEAELKPTDQE